MRTTAVAGSITVANAIVPTSANPKPAKPLTAPETTNTITRITSNDGEKPAIIGVS